MITTCGSSASVVILAITILITPVFAVAVETEAVSFSAADGHRIAAGFLPAANPPRSGAPAVVLLHMYRSDRAAWEPLLEPLHEAGFAVLAIDLRGHGESATTATRDRVEQRDTSVFREMQDDLRGAYDWLAKRSDIDRSRFALVGASVGCSIALQYAAKDHSVDAIVCLSPGLNYLGLDSAGDVHQITGRKILMLATEDERDAPYTLQKRGDSIEVKIYPRREAHGTNMFGTIGRVEEEIVQFLKAGVGRPTNTTVFGSINSNIYHQRGSGWIGRISPTNLRYYSSPAEAEIRGLRAARSQGPSRSKRGR